MKITQQERERYKLDCRARHFASQWLGGEPTASVDDFVYLGPIVGTNKASTRYGGWTKRRWIAVAKRWLQNLNSSIIFIDKSITPPEVDHFFPHVLKQHNFGSLIDGVWNLQLACKDCNRGNLVNLHDYQRCVYRNDYIEETNFCFWVTILYEKY
jgi:5-methylcytosine-specific restriction endonuclease McrA